MIKISNSLSLTDFQRNARAAIEKLNEGREPLLVTVNGRVQAVLIDPQSYDEIEEELERKRMVAGIRLALEQAQRGEGVPLEQFVAELKAKYDL